MFWRGFRTALKRRGLTGIRLVISDQHAGLVAALKRSFQGAAHQRCRVHFTRNLLAHVPKTHTDMLAAFFRTVFAQPDPATVAATWDEVRDQLATRFPKVGVLMEAAKAEVLAFTAFPRPVPGVSPGAGADGRDSRDQRGRLPAGVLSEGRGPRLPASTVPARRRTRYSKKPSDRRVDRQI